MHDRARGVVILIVKLWFAMVVCAVAHAGEYAVLESGFRLKIERRETAGALVRLYTSADGFIEMPASAIVAYEPEEVVPQPPPSAHPGAAAEPQAPPPTPQELVDMAAANNGLPAEFLHLVARAESAYRQDAVSPKGAIGIMQLMPSTAAALNADPNDPAQNVEAGARYLRDLLIKYQNHPDQLRRALAAYNAGPGAVDRYNGVPPYRETQLYVNRIVEAYRQHIASK